jgi:hypothetical protein
MSNTQVDKLIYAARMGLGDLIYLAETTNQWDRFKGTMELIQQALEPYQFIEFINKQETK